MNPNDDLENVPFRYRVLTVLAGVVLALIAVVAQGDNYTNDPVWKFFFG